MVNQSKIWQTVGTVSATIGLVCFPFGSTYHMSFGSFGKIGGIFVYLLVCITIKLVPEEGPNRIRVPEKAKDVVGAILFVAITSISVVHDTYVPGKSDALTIISYGSFALMSVSLSRKLELGFETGFTNFFLQLFSAQLFKIKWFLFPISLFFSSLIIVLRHHPKEQEVGSITPNNGSHHTPPYTIDIERLDSQRQSPLSTTNNQENNEAESSQAPMDRSPSIGQVPEESMMLLDARNQQNRKEVAELSTLLHLNESWNQDHVSSIINAVQRDKRWEIPNILHNVGDTLAGEIQNIRHNVGDATTGDIQNIPHNVGDATTGDIQNIPHNVGDAPSGEIQNIPHNVGDAPAGEIQNIPHNVGDAPAGEIQNIPHNVGDAPAGEIQNIPHNVGDAPAGEIQNIPHNFGEALAYGIQSISRKVGHKVTDGVQNLSHNVGGTIRRFPAKMVSNFFKKKKL